jgi:hypothetical protein
MSAPAIITSFHDPYTVSRRAAEMIECGVAARGREHAVPELPARQHGRLPAAGRAGPGRGRDHEHQRQEDRRGDRHALRAAVEPVTDQQRVRPVWSPPPDGAPQCQETGGPDGAGTTIMSA